MPKHNLVAVGLRRLKPEGQPSDAAKKGECVTIRLVCFSLEGLASYAVAADRYIRDTGDDQVVEEPSLADTLYQSSDELAARRNRSVPLYSTEVSPSGDVKCTYCNTWFNIHRAAPAAPGGTSDQIM